MEKEMKKDISARIERIYVYALTNNIVTNKGEFADLVKITQVTMSRFFSGKRIPSLKTIRQINAAFGSVFSEEWILFGTGEMFEQHTIPHIDHSNNASNTHAPVYQNTGKGGNNVTQNDVNGELLTIIHKRDEQIDRLLTIIEKMNQPQNIE